MRHDLQSLIHRALSAKPGAADQLATCLREKLSKYIRKHIWNPEDAEDATQRTLISIIRAIGDRKYVHHNEAMFMAWAYRIARSEIFAVRPPPPPGQAPPVSIDADETVELEDIGPSVEASGERHGLMELIDRELDEAVVLAPRTDGERDRGILKKLAFVEYYIDERTINEVFISINLYAQQLDPTLNISMATLNNWLYRGDILRQLVKRLVDLHRDTLDKLTDNETYADLTPDELTVLKGYWFEGKDIPALADQLMRPKREVRALLQNARMVVVDRLVRSMRAAHHTMRFQDSA